MFMDFALCAYRFKLPQPRLALMLRQRGEQRLLLLNDGTFLNTSQWHCYPLSYLDELPVVERIALLDESASTFPMLVRVVAGPALARPGVRVMVGCDTLHPTRGLVLNVGWSGTYDMIDRVFGDVESAVRWTTDELTRAAARTSARLRLYFAPQTQGRFDGAGYREALTRDGYQVDRQKKAVSA